MKTTRTKKPADLFKPAARGDRLTAVYLYADGHALAAFERRIRDVGGQTVRYFKQIDRLGPSCNFRQGRICFTDGGTWLRCMLAAGVRSFSASPPSLENGGQTTRERGIPVSYVAAETAFGSVYVYCFPGLLSSDVIYQPDVSEVFNASLENFGYQATIAETLLTEATAETVGGVS